MSLSARASWLLSQEARALLTRLNRVRPFVLYETMVPAAAPSPVANTAIEKFMAGNRRRMRALVHMFLRWLLSPVGRSAPPWEMQRRFTVVRLQFNNILSHLDIFADVITQRSENETGVWLSGLDTVAADALKLPGGYYDEPPVVCYLDRGPGAAIRRARTRMPGGGENPVAIIRVPRERMVGSGIASSLVHEVGHQAAALLDLVPSLRVVLHGLQKTRSRERKVWQLWERWISEIVADFWSIARVGIASTTGLMGVVSLPRVFVFRLSMDDPHPPPWIRVNLSCAIGAALYPHPQWEALRSLWNQYYPLDFIEEPRRTMFTAVLETMDAFVSLLVNHRPKALRGASLSEVMRTEERRPAVLSGIWRRWRLNPSGMRAAPPTIVFAVLGQARANGAITPEEESRIVGELLTWWAMSDALDVSAICAESRQRRFTVAGR
jgi:hypothetical protein